MSKSGVVLVGAADLVADRQGAVGEVLEVARDGVIVAAKDGAVRLSDLSDLAGLGCDAEEMFTVGTSCRAAQSCASSAGKR